MTKDDAIKLIKEFATRIKPFYEPKRTDYAKAIDMAIEALQADRPSGVWIWCGDKGDSRFMCSVCKSKENVPTCMGEPTIWDYCPNCGARMQNGYKSVGQAWNTEQGRW